MQINAVCRGQAPGDAFEEVVLADCGGEPRGVALDRVARELYVAVANTVVRVSLDSGAVRTVLAQHARAAPDGLLVLPSDVNGTTKGDRTQRLLWLDANANALQAATREGLRVSTVPADPSFALRFGRALARDAETGELVLGEWLGRIWRLAPGGKKPLLLRDDASTNAAPSVRATLDAEDTQRRRLQPALATLLRL